MFGRVDEKNLILCPLLVLRHDVLIKESSAPVRDAP